MKKQVKCEICGKTMAAQGMTNHKKWNHPSSDAILKATYPKPEQPVGRLKWLETQCAGLQRDLDEAQSDAGSYLAELDKIKGVMRALINDPKE